jgi:Transposase IS4
MSTTRKNAKDMPEELKRYLFNNSELL